MFCVHFTTWTMRCTFHFHGQWGNIFPLKLLTLNPFKPSGFGFDTLILLERNWIKSKHFDWAGLWVWFVYLCVKVIPLCCSCILSAQSNILTVTSEILKGKTHIDIFFKSSLLWKCWQTLKLQQRSWALLQHPFDCGCQKKERSKLVFPTAHY